MLKYFVFLTLLAASSQGNQNLVDPHENIDIVNIKALSELHGELRAKTSRPRQPISSSGDYNFAENEIDQKATTTRRNAIEHFLLKQKLINEKGTMPDVFYEEGLPVEILEAATTPEVTLETLDVPLEDVPEYQVSLLEEQSDISLSETEVAVTTSTTVAPEPMVREELIVKSLPTSSITGSSDSESKSLESIYKRPKEKSRYQSISCFECYGCKTYYLRKIRRCPRHHDMCVKEVSVGRRIAINGRNLIEIEINQYCSTGECPRSDGNVTFACCYTNLCNAATRHEAQFGFLVTTLLFGIKFLLLKS